LARHDAALTHVAAQAARPMNKAIAPPKKLIGLDQPLAWWLTEFYLILLALTGFGHDLD
jgi:hypothetical protein